MGFIYKISNDINDLVYIGQTIKTVDYRFKEHIRESKRESQNQKKLTKFHQAIVELGADHFQVETIEECANDLLDKREIFWINYYNSFWCGYNSTLGGQYRFNVSANKVIQYDINGNYIHLFLDAKEAAESVNRDEASIRDACCRRRKTCAGYQWRYYQEDFPSIIAPLLSDSSAHCDSLIKKAVIQYDIFGKKIRQFGSIEEASTLTGIRRGNISRACHSGGTTKAGGFQWRFLNSEDIPIDLSPIVKDKRIPKTTYAVMQYDKNNILIKEWNSIKEAASSLNIRSSLIINVCEGKQKTAGKFIWKYKI